ncbi:Hypothetical predicted protein [Olea europaea subsp. europaea]|uniref:Uncharacterized protein n=1 Tax=Olea europaea subsp. europaea TaxID=158383 RepID=A0A8S0UKR0_OLEEU|nr:Hypothetical predicted protein [Olea europaea subsp. europaea]
METKNRVEQNQISVLLEGEGFNRILARESSVGQSSRMFYRHAEGVPFKWEMQPGTAKNPPEKDVIPPLSPPPLIQSLGLPLPQVDEPEEAGSKHSRIWHNWKKMLKKSSQNNSSSFGDSDEEFAANSSSSSSNCHISESSRVGRELLDGPFCCSPWNITAALDEGNTKIYYCRTHKTTFALEEDGLIFSRILSRVSSVDQSGPLHSTEITSSGIPFKWEMQPGTPKNAPENDVIPPPSPPPAVQSLALPWPTPPCTCGEEKTKSSKWSRVWFWIKIKKMIKQNENVQELSFRYDHKMEFCKPDKEFDAFLRSSSSSSAHRTSWTLRLSKIRRDCLSWISRNNEAILVYATRKLKH